MGIMTNAVILIVIVLFCYNANFNPWIILINIAFIPTIAESELKAAKEDAIVENAEIIQEYYNMVIIAKMRQNQFVKNVVLVAIQYLLQMASKETN
ncbi:MAG: hypothetical protein ACJ73C_11170 [Nitrososphaeraceae archaeon]